MDFNSEIRNCSRNECKKKFAIIGQEQLFYQRKELPLPEHCPSCRHIMRMALRSERQLYRRTCKKCNSSILSTYPEKAPYIIYCQSCFWEEID